MHYFRFVLGFAALAMAVVSLARPDLNSFLNRKVTTVRALVSQAKHDPEVMDRYRRHYAMTSNEVIAFLSTLQAGRTSKEGVSAIYSVPPDGHIKLHYGKIRQGSPIFSDFAGNAVLLARCGNPLGRGPKSPTASNDTSGLTAQSNDDLREFDSDIDSPAIEDLYAMTPQTPTVPQEVFTTTQSPVVILPAAFGINPLIFGLGGLPLLIGGGDDDTVVESVPEPMSMAVLGIGIAMVAARRKRKS